jgi:hypothetical protein
MAKRPTDPFYIWGKEPKLSSLFNWFSLMEIPLSDPLFYREKDRLISDVPSL